MAKAGTYLAAVITAIYAADTLAQSVCNQPLVTGPCRARFTRWGSENGVCREFTYGGCQRNGNNFRTRKACEDACLPVTTTTTQNPVSVCNQTLVVGPCDGAFERWASRNGVCEKFTYGGCGGNNNNFMTKVECEAACPPADICSLPLFVGPCEALFTRWGSINGQCVQFTYGGCQANANNFRSKEDCEKLCPPEDRCSLPIESGPCEAAIRRWGSLNGQCVGFTYGGCQGNSNNFESLADCESACPPALNTTTVAPVDTCTLPLRTGPCRANFPRWGSSDGQCVQFTYGGCRANENNFQTKEQCESACPPVEKCMLPLKTGPCRASIPRWGSKDGKCEQFTYGGCQGNENNFESQADCEAACPPVMNITTTTSSPVDKCGLPLVTGPCRARFPSWGSRGGQCVKFTYGGCGGNENRFSTKEECESACTPVDKCTLPLKTGPCRASIPRWGSKDGKCEQFTYGGCQGNDNNFETQAACEEACTPAMNATTEPPANRCELPLVPGNCLANFPSWGNSDGQCIKFTYGGCGGNDNRFPTKEECEAACPPIDKCSLPLITGNCRASIPRWGSKDGKCERFTYGGCNGNRNNFQTKAECEAACPPVDLCQLPLETGPCKARVPSWGFRNGKCVKFIYGGCQGNANRFSNRRACLNKCNKGGRKSRRCRNPNSRTKRGCVAGANRWVYDTENNRCTRRQQQTCDGRKGAVGFRTRRGCERLCKD